MSMQQQRERKSAYGRLIICRCGASAMLIRRVLMEAGTGELHIYRCYACHEITEMAVES
jgi:predicted SprT family Zn-dependent metalloprotease